MATQRVFLEHSILEVDPSRWDSLNDTLFYVLLQAEGDATKLMINDEVVKLVLMTRRSGDRKTLKRPR